MNNHKIIDTNQLKSKFKFSEISEDTKNKLIVGGLSFAGIAMAIGLNRIFISEDKVVPVSSKEESSENTLESAVNESYETVEHIEVDEATFSNEEASELEYSSEVTYEEAEYSISFDSDAAFAQSIDDSMDFSSAFAQAREQVGMGGFFNWNNNSYSTYTLEEWNDMSPDDQQAFFADVASKTQLDTNEWAIEENTQQDESQITEEVAYEESEELETIDSSEIEFEDTLEPTETQPEINQDSDVETVTIVPPAAYGSADINSDNIVDAIVIDTNNDGKADLLALDEDYDGTFESFRINEDGDEDLDVFIIDQGADGIDDTDTIEEIADVVDMDDFIVIEGDDPSLDGLDFIDELIDIDEDETLEDDSSLDTTFDDPGL